MKKNVMKDTADNVVEAIISKINEGTFLVVKEEVFQAVSKSDEGGFRRISGYTEYRISSYDVNTGQLVKRIVLGNRKENECRFLGETDGKLWYKSVDKELGIHVRDPKSLDVIIPEAKIIEINPFLKNNLSQPEWSNVQGFYGFDINAKMPMVSDNSGYVYYIDPVSLKAEKTNGSIKNFDYDETCTSSSMKLDVNTSIYLRGSPRNSIKLFNKEINEPSFLKGDFLKSSIVMNAFDANPDFILPYKKEVEKYRKEIDSMNNILNTTDTTSINKFNNSYKTYTLRNAERNIGYTNDKIKSAENNIKRYADDKYYEIITADKSVFLISQTDVTDQAKIIISKVKLNSDTTVSLQWETVLKDIYRDPEKGFDKSSFDVVFSKGNPDLKAMRVLISGEKLFFIFMLKAICFDVGTGKVLWNFDI
ncbi:MAG: PA2928 family protein [Ignavibacteria bacterium]